MDAAYYRRRAAEVRADAALAPLEAVREKLLAIAEMYDQLAAQATQRPDKRPPRSD